MTMELVQKVGKQELLAVLEHSYQVTWVMECKELQ